MEVSKALCQQDQLQLIAEKRKWQTEVENKKRQLEDDRRALQHLKSKALREHWLLDGAPSAGPDQDEIKRQLEQDKAKSRSLEEAINRLERELVRLEAGAVCQTITHTTVSSGAVKVVHEMNGEDGVHLLSSSEVDELIHKADEASMMSQTAATVISLPPAEVHEEALPPSPQVTLEITGLEAKPGSAPSVAEASVENPVTMVFMGYQSVEDEDETKKVLGLQGTVKAELVHIDDSDGKTSPGGEGMEEASSLQTAAPPLASATVTTPLPTTRPPEVIAASNGETAEGGAVAIKKEKQPCKCCSIM
uniref:Paralemmin-1 n=1 Tax=Monopterus albus TaxID=43700 RepID=A0A3Q3KLL0_MONAL